MFHLEIHCIGQGRWCLPQLFLSLKTCWNKTWPKVTWYLPSIKKFKCDNSYQVLQMQMDIYERYTEVWNERIRGWLRSTFWAEQTNLDVQVWVWMSMTWVLLIISSHFKKFKTYISIQSISREIQGLLIYSFQIKIDCLH